jgi:pimeloyl-ACP methyl ester carboxylesterase
MATVVLAHGAWSSAWAWKKVRPLMAAAGHTFFTPSYTGLGEREHLANPSNDLDTHIRDVLGVIDAEELNDFVLMGHSYGGMVATGVADRARERISQLIYLDAFVPKNGQSLSDLVPPEQGQRMKDSAAQGDGWRVSPNPTPGDTSPDDMAWVSRHRRPQSLKCFEQKLQITAEPSMPRAYIQCMKYAEHGPFNQFAKRAKSEPGWKSYELDTSHSPNVTAPEALVKLLGQVIAERGK